MESEFETATGAVQVRDFMSRRDGIVDLVRIVRGIRGNVSMHTEIKVRFDYGSSVPWVSRLSDGRLQYTAGPNRMLLDTAVQLRGEHLSTVGEFRVSAGVEARFSFSWAPSYRAHPTALQIDKAFFKAKTYWEKWTQQFKSDGEWGDEVLRSLITLKALTHRATGGIVAAGTTSLPEKIGGSRNWDYRYCWLRDATFTLYAFIGAGYLEEARAWSEWLIRAIGGNPEQLQIMYGVSGIRRLSEYEATWLPGYQRSAPVHIGNVAAGQLQLDVYGEVLDALCVARKAGLSAEAASRSLECALVGHLETIWQEPDEGIWEVRGGRKQFTYSKVMAWVAFDRAVRSVEEFGLAGPVARWRSARDTIHDQICEQGFSSEHGAFVQSYGSTALDASVLMMALVGFLPAEDPRMQGTVAAIERDLIHKGLVLRYHSHPKADGLPPGEGA